jgi:hypothetical protein
MERPVTELVIPSLRGTNTSELPALHDRRYDVEAYRVTSDRIIVLGSVRDSKPPGTYFRDERGTIEIHEMAAELILSYPELDIVEAAVNMSTHPHGECPGIVESYQQLVGLNIGRGFTPRIRELFGGPRGCTHVTALLLAMAPVVMQASYSMGLLEHGLEPVSQAGASDLHVNTCHVWAEGKRPGDSVDRTK